MYAGTYFTDPGRMVSWVNFSGKWGHPNLYSTLNQAGDQTGIFSIGRQRSLLLHQPLCFYLRQLQVWRSSLLRTEVSTSFLYSWIWKRPLIVYHIVCTLLWAMRRLHIPEWLVGDVQTMYANCRVQISNTFSDDFKIQVGVHQGFVLDPLTYNYSLLFRDP